MGKNVKLLKVGRVCTKSTGKVLALLVVEGAVQYKVQVSQVVREGLG